LGTSAAAAAAPTPRPIANPNVMPIRTLPMVLPISQSDLPRRLRRPVQRRHVLRRHGLRWHGQRAALTGGVLTRSVSCPSRGKNPVDALGLALGRPGDDVLNGGSSQAWNQAWNGNGVRRPGRARLEQSSWRLPSIVKCPSACPPRAQPVGYWTRWHSFNGPMASLSTAGCPTPDGPASGY
jgi:hypothetical protein